MSDKNELMRKLTESMPQSFWDSLIVAPPGEKLPPIKLDDLVDPGKNHE